MFLLAAIPLAAQTPPAAQVTPPEQVPGKVLSLVDCIKLAQSVPSAVSIAEQDARIAAYGVTAARAGFFPQLSATGGFNYNTPLAGGGTYIALNGPHEYITTGNVGLEIDTSGRLRAAYGRAKMDREIAGTSARISARDLRQAVTVAYYRLLLARKLVEAAGTSLTEARSFEARTKLLFGGGEAAQADVVKASVQVASFEQLHKAAQLDAQVANQELASFWTSDVTQPLSLEDTLVEPGADSATQNPAAQDPDRPFLRRPEFRLFDLQKQGYRYDARRERAALLPQLTANYQYGIDASVYSFSQRGSAVVVALNVPIFDWFRARSLGREFDLRAKESEATRALSERAFSKDYENAKARLSSASDQMAAAKAQVQLGQENLRLAQLRYTEGEGPSLDVVAAQTQLQQARSNYFNTLFLYANARADLEVAAGR